MKKWMIGGLLILSLVPHVQAKSAHRIGVGANYWVAMKNIDIDDIDKYGFSVLGSYQYRQTLLGFQADVEFLPDLFGDDAIAPAAYLVLGEAIYAAAGVGMVYRDGDWADDPFFAVKVGLDLEVVRSLFLDIGVSYRFNSTVQIKDAVKDIDTDTVFLGAAVRIGF